MYQTLVRQVVTYACKTWVLKENIKSKLKVFERKILRRIYGPTKETDGTWKIKSNEELRPNAHERFFAAAVKQP